jgi:phosphoglycerate kinase
MKGVQEADVEGKSVLVRVDFNVTLLDGDVREKFKMKSAYDTIKLLQEKRAKSITLITHLGRPDGEFDESLSLKNIVDDVDRILGIRAKFVSDCVGPSVARAVEEAKESEVILLENLRFHKGEEENDDDFSQKLAKPFDIFVNDAFSVCHRSHASTVGLVKHLPTYAGMYLQKEIRVLSQIREAVKSPSLAIVGGAKIATKLPLIEIFSELFDTVLVGGKVANEILDQDIKLPKNVLLPLDFERDRYDIGKKTRELFKEKIQGMETIVWNGPLGKFEEEEFSRGTVEIAKAVAKSDAFSVVGGGESIEVLEDLFLLREVGFVSTGGGAMLSYLMGEDMPGLNVLQQDNQ